MSGNILVKKLKFCNFLNLKIKKLDTFLIKCIYTVLKRYSQI